MNANVLHVDDDSLSSISDSGILFEKACGSENIHVIKTGETTAITFGDRGVRNAECVHTFYDQILELIVQNQCRVLSLDMRGVWFLPSRTLGALISLRKAVERIELQNVSDELREIFQIAQLDQLFLITGSEDPQTSELVCKDSVPAEVEISIETTDPSDDFDPVHARSRDAVSKTLGNEVPFKGKITQISLSKGSEFPHHGYGVISTPDGGEVYFRAESLVNVEFPKLELESEVHFVEEQGTDVRQARSVWLLVPYLAD